MLIGGNVNLAIKVLDPEKVTYDENGKKTFEYKNEASLFGFLDLLSGDSRYDNKAKIEDSTHIFVCDYIEGITDINIEDSTKAFVDNQEYDVKYIDDPMGLHEHLEIYLKKVGGQNA